MKNKITITLVVGCVLLGLYLYARPAEPTPSILAGLTPYVPPVIYDDVQAGWVVATNARLGFSVFLPQTVTEFPFALYDDGELVSIAPTKAVEYLPQSSVVDKIITVTPEMIKTKWFVPHFDIYVDQLTSEDDIEPLIQSRYYEECTVGAKSRDSQSGVYNYQFGEGPAEGCPGHFVVKYDRVTKKLLTLMYSAHDWTFGTDRNGVYIDGNIVSSLRFIR